MIKTIKIAAIGSLVGVVVGAAPVAAATALEQSCRMLSVIGGNAADEVASVFAEVLARWPEQNRVGATQQMEQMLGQLSYAGGNVYEIGRFGEDVVDHLLVLRRAEGETAGLLLRYEWTPDGMALTKMDYKLEYLDEMGLPGGVFLDPLGCP